MGPQRSSQVVMRRVAMPVQRTGPEVCGWSAVRGTGRRQPYHRRVLPAPWLLALGLVLGLIVLIPARRLQLAGLSRVAVGSYAAFLWALGMFVAIRPIGIRFLLPILLIMYVAPFVAGPERVARVLARRRPDDRPPMKNVTPPDDGPPDA